MDNGKTKEDNDGEIHPRCNGKKSNSKKNGNGKIKNLGPVPNLEEHVPPDWWNRIFNSLYLITDGDVVNDPNITHQEVDSFSKILNFSLEDRILDLCCGQGRHSLELARRGFKNVEGLDRSHYLIRRARDQAKLENLSVKFKEGDARKLPYQLDTFNYTLILGNSFGYFYNKLNDLKVLREVLRVLKPSGKILIDVANGENLRKNFQKHSWEWINNKLFVCRERQFSIDGERLISREIISHVEKGVIADQFYAERLYSEEDLFELMKDAGFSYPLSHGTISPYSLRNQDLGMMGNRLIVTAEVTAESKKNYLPKKPRQNQEVKNVIVVMGDPNKSDPLKPNKAFDEDDFDTINKLKSALAELKDYKFTYLDNHNTIISDLRKLNRKSDFVLNLCDEGLNNEPRKELHIPTILEILNIPYTGAGPQCLAFCYDKSLVRGVAKEMGISIPKGYFIKPEDIIITLPDISFPVIAKPNFGDSSFGITQHSVAKNPEQLLNAVSEIRQKFGYEKPILVEEFLAGKDLSLGIIGNLPSNYLILPIIEDDYSSLPKGLPSICGYEAKWDSKSKYWDNVKTIEADIPQETKDTIINSSLKLHERLECRDYTRFDWRLDAEGNPKLLEVNPNPGWCWDGHLAKMSNYADISYPQMLLKIILAAEQRFNGYFNMPQSLESSKKEKQLV